MELENIYWKEFIKNTNIDIESIKVLKENKDKNNIIFYLQTKIYMFNYKKFTIGI